ncbi:hypothetical protein ACFLRN_09455 [Thermoproteota archaeon]
MSEEAAFRAILAIACLIIGTLLSISSVFLSFIPLFLGIIIALTGLIIFLIDTIS